VLRGEGAVVVYIASTSYTEGIYRALVLVGPITIVGAASLATALRGVIVALAPRVVPLD